MLDTYRQRFNHLEDKHVKPTLPAVLVAHAQVRGIANSDLFQPSDKEDMILDSTDLPDHYQYSAYGHIHKAQPVVPGSKHQNYAGSLLPLDAGEQGQEKGVWLFEIKERKRLGDPVHLPLAGPKLHELTILPEDIDKLPDLYPDAATALVKYRLKFDPHKHPDPFILHERIRQVFPRWYDAENEIEGIESTSDEAESHLSRSSDVQATVLDYLRTVATFDSDKDKVSVIALAENLFANNEFVTKWKG
jgi:DNA repair exonuclease SbcCD nuclease subunit